jgi:phospholipid transport system substrate-binding protein
MTRTLTLALVCLSTAALAGPKEELTKPLNIVVKGIRYEKYKDALKQFAGEEQGKFLCGDAWAKGTDAQRKEFVDLFLQLFGKIAFPKIHKNFENLDTILYDEPTVTGDTAEIPSTILINHPMKKQELKVKYKLVKLGGAWKVVDVSVLGDSMLKGIRDDQVQPILADPKDGGWEGLLKTMRAKNAELKDVVLK